MSVLMLYTVLVKREGVIIHIDIPLYTCIIIILNWKEKTRKTYVFNKAFVYWVRVVYNARFYAENESKKKEITEGFMINGR